MSHQQKVVAVFGGSFNPPHVGHGMVARWLTWTGWVDAVWLVPVYRHAFEGRHDKRLAPFAARLEWCAAFCADLGPGIEVCGVEAELPVPSYTIDTLRHLRATVPDTRFRLVVGADALPHLPAWRAWEAIAAEFDPIIVGRQGYPIPESVDAIDFPEVSSTEVRRRIRDGAPVSHLLTRRVRGLVDARAWDAPSE